MAITKRPPATAEQVQIEASGYILCKLGNFLWAGDPTFDEKRKLWTVPIHSRALSKEEALGHILLNAYSKIVQAPSRHDLQRSQEQLESSSILQSALPSHLAFAFRGNGETSQEPLALPDLPDDPMAIGQELLSDPDIKTAHRYLKRALADSHMRQSVLAALEAFARAAHPTEKENE